MKAAGWGQREGGKGVRAKGRSVKSKQSDAQREIELEERVSLFFINRPIKQGRLPSPPPFSPPHRCFISFDRFPGAHARFFLPYLFLPFFRCLRSHLFRLVSFFSPCCREYPSLSSVSVRPLGRLAPFPGAKLSPSFHPRSRGDAPFVALGPGSGSLFAILFNFFARGWNPFITWARDSSV